MADVKAMERNDRQRAPVNAPSAGRARCNATVEGFVGGRYDFWRCRQSAVLQDDGTCLCRMHLPGYKAPPRSPRKMPCRGPRGPQRTLFHLRWGAVGVDISNKRRKGKLAKELPVVELGGLEGISLWNKLSLFLPEHIKSDYVRKDLINDIYCDIMMNNDRVDQGHLDIKAIMNSYFKEVFDRRTVSLESCIPGAGRLRIIDKLSQDDALFGANLAPDKEPAHG